MKTPALILAPLALVAACDPGSVDDGQTQDELVCSASLTMAGTLAVSAPKPAEIDGCWPIGTWTFTATVGEHDCSAAPTPLAQYQIKVDRDLASEDPDYTWTYEYLTDPSVTADIGVTSGGGGLCEAIVMLYSADGKTVWNMHPALQADNTLNGTGDYEVHTVTQIPTEGN